MSHLQLSAVTVLYHPTEITLKSIASYNEHVRRICVVDNTEDDSSLPVLHSIYSLFPQKIDVIRNKKNMGIAAALNTGFQQLSRTNRGVSGYVLTMDQDSVCDSDMIFRMIQFIEKKAPRVPGLVSPLLVNNDLYYDTTEKSLLSDFQEVLYAMTSGSMINFEAYRHCGPFREDLFIDSVDEEYCLRLRNYGHLIYRVNSAKLVHSLGITETPSGIMAKMLNRIRPSKKMYITNHSPLRRYYITRNKLTVARLYRKTNPEFRRSVWRYLIESFFKILFYEKSKGAKILFMAKGMIDYRKGILDEYAHK